MKKQLQGALALLFATLIWGTTFVAQSVGMDHIDPFTFQAIRCAMGGIALLILITLSDFLKKDSKTFLSRWKDPKLWKAGLLCGSSLFLAANLQQVGIVDTDAGKSAFLTAMYIVFVPILGIFRKKKPSKWIPVSVLLGVAGLYCLSCVGVTKISRSDLLLIGCAVMFAVQITFVDIYAPQVDCLRLNCLNCFICAGLSALVMWLTEQPSLPDIRNCLGALAYAGVLSMGIAYTLQIVGQKYVEASAASLLMSMESVVAVLSGCLILHETLTVWETIGCVLVFTAIILSQLPEKRPAKKPI